MSSLLIYILGFIIVIAGLAMAATLLGISQSWIIVGIVILLGLMLLAIASGIRRH